jgi:hypothetical protein
MLAVGVGFAFRCAGKGIGFQSFPVPSCNAPPSFRRRRGAGRASKTNGAVRECGSGVNQRIPADGFVRPLRAQLRFFAGAGAAVQSEGDRT